MSDTRAANGTIVTEEAIDKWCEALDRDEWPEGWENKGEVIYGRPPSTVNCTATLSIKLPAAMKQAIAEEAKKHGTSTSNYARALLAEAMLA